MSDSETEDIDELLSQLNEREEENQQKCFRRSAVRIAQEIRRRAKAEQRLMPYMHACFRVMVNSASLFDAGAGRDASIELIRLLESPDQARRIQPELSEGEYEHAIHWMSSCAYDNLADNTAELLGYNSDGMHQCINDGIQVCRRTGKMQCISCFREYAANVYCAADDLEMAIHFARQSLENPNPASEGRRWASSHTYTRMLLRAGDLVQAVDSLQRGWQLVNTYHSPLEAQHKTYLLYSEIMALLGQEADARLAPAEYPPRDEYPYLHMSLDYVTAVRELMQGDFQSAIDRLIVWDTQAQSRQQLSNWFQTRLRLLCALRMAGDTKRLQSLTQELEPAARKARDWYTLRCLTQINDQAQPPLPVPVLKPFNAGPLAPIRASATRSAVPLASSGTSTDTANADPGSVHEAVPAGSETEAAQATAAQDSGNAAIPDLPEDLAPLAMNIMLMAQQQQFGVELDAQTIAEARESLLTRSADADSPPERVHWLLHLMTFVPTAPEHAQAVWQWAEKLAGLRTADGVALNLLAAIGSKLLPNEAEPGSGPVSQEQIADMMRRSLDMEPARASNFERAGDFYALVGDDSEAERNYARAFRLDRSRTSAALSLADIYSRSDRPTDALEVLDISLREGRGDARAAWQAAVLSSYLQKYEAALTYLKRFGQDMPDHAWMQFYRAQALLALHRPDEAAEATRLFSQGEPERQFVIKLLQCAAHGQKRDLAATLQSMRELLAEPISSVDYLTGQALVKLFDILLEACQWLDETHTERGQLLQMIIGAGLTPERHFEATRTKRAKEEGISFYIVSLYQPLPEDWPRRSSCGPGQQDWTQYFVRYGVLSTSQAKAERLACEFQAQAGLGPVQLHEVQAFDQEYLDSPGIVWQSLPEPNAE